MSLTWLYEPAAICPPCSTLASAASMCTITESRSLVPSPRSTR